MLMKGKWIAVILVVVFIGLSLSMCSGREERGVVEESQRAEPSPTEAVVVTPSSSPEETAVAATPVNEEPKPWETTAPALIIPMEDVYQEEPIEPLFDSATNTIKTNQGVIELDEDVTGVDSESNT